LILSIDGGIEIKVNFEQLQNKRAESSFKGEFPENTIDFRLECAKIALPNLSTDGGIVRDSSFVHPDNALSSIIFSNE